ncbi:hypothetical protein E4U42_004697 [Claviceps africana]|uniref:Uncharacterized protein n=1 Tax=Claviceps africana TaxID=83212 RepID=A0A8K0J736_9HYPO|nr:hypothetical protein E4U42_004697 [Claviceps africana]
MNGMIRSVTLAEYQVECVTTLLDLLLDTLLLILISFTLVEIGLKWHFYEALQSSSTSHTSPFSGINSIASAIQEDDPEENSAYVSIQRRNAYRLVGRLDILRDLCLNHDRKILSSKSIMTPTYILYHSLLCSSLRKYSYSCDVNLHNCRLTVLSGLKYRKFDSLPASAPLVSIDLKSIASISQHSSETCIFQTKMATQNHCCGSTS